MPDETPIPEWAVRTAQSVAANFCNTDSMVGGMWVEAIARALVEVETRTANEFRSPQCLEQVQSEVAQRIQAAIKDQIEIDCGVYCNRCKNHEPVEFSNGHWRHPSGTDIDFACYAHAIRTHRQRESENESETL